MMKNHLPFHSNTTGDWWFAIVFTVVYHRQSVWKNKLKLRQMKSNRIPFSDPQNSVGNPNCFGENGILRLSYGLVKVKSDVLFIHRQSRSRIVLLQISIESLLLFSCRRFCRRKSHENVRRFVAFFPVRTLLAWTKCVTVDKIVHSPKRLKNLGYYLCLRQV